jgi:FdhD protein
VDRATAQSELRGIRRIASGRPAEQVTDSIVRERQMRIVLNDQELAVASILPGEEREFCYGLLYSSGLIASANDVSSWEFDALRGIAFVTVDGKLQARDVAAPPVALGTACGSQALTVSSMQLSPVQSRLQVSAAAIRQAVASLRRDSVLFRQTGGVHSAALCQPEGGMLLRSDDIGRHNACDKVIGAALLRGTSEADQHFLVSTGRLSGEIVTKAWRFKFPLVASPSAPTSRALEIAESAAITLIGFVRAGRLNIYCGEHRVTGGEPC